MRLLALCLLLAGPAQGFEGCVAEEMAAFEARLTEALNTQAAPNFDLVRGQAVADCGGIALLQCGGDGSCEARVGAEMLAQAARFAQVPTPEAVAGRNPPWSDGLYPPLWARVNAGCVICTDMVVIGHLGDAAHLWQVARAIGVVEADAWR